MRKGFFLTENEKTRISKFYKTNIDILLEQSEETPEAPQTKEDIIKFQKWMNEKAGKWAYSKKSRAYYKVQDDRSGLGNYGKNTQQAWKKSGQTYLDEMKPKTEPQQNKSEVSVEEPKEWKYYHIGDKKWSGKMTKTEIQDLLDKGEISGDTYIYKIKIGVNPKAHRIKNLDAFDTPPEIPDQNSSEGGDSKISTEKSKTTSDDENVSTSTSVEGNKENTNSLETSKKQTTNDEKSKVSKNEKSVEGLQATLEYWHDKQINPKDIVVKNDVGYWTVDNKEYVYKYENGEWNPNSKTRIKVIEPKPKVDSKNLQSPVDKNVKPEDYIFK